MRSDKFLFTCCQMDVLHYIVDFILQWTRSRSLKRNSVTKKLLQYNTDKITYYINYSKRPKYHTLFIDVSTSQMMSSSGLISGFWPRLNSMNFTDAGVKHLFVRIYIAHYAKTVSHTFSYSDLSQFRSDRPWNRKQLVPDVAQLVVPIILIHVVGLSTPYGVPYCSTGPLWCMIHDLHILPIYQVILTGHMVGPRGSAVERQSLASVLSPSCARPVADGWPL